MVIYIKLENPDDDPCIGIDLGTTYCLHVYTSIDIHVLEHGLMEK